MTDPATEEKSLRLFTAITLPPDIRDTVAAYGEVCRNASPSSIRWVAAENLHLTLKFYGDTEVKQLPLLQSTLKKYLSGLESPVLQLAGTGAFPSWHRPAIFWVGVEILSGVLAPLAMACEDAGRETGLASEKKKFIPHITIGRLRRKKAFSHREREVLSSLTPSRFGQEFQAQNVVLFRSQLTRRGPVYTALEEYPLA